MHSRFAELRVDGPAARMYQEQPQHSQPEPVMSSQLVGSTYLTATYLALACCMSIACHSKLYHLHLCPKGLIKVGCLVQPTHTLAMRMLRSAFVQDVAAQAEGYDAADLRVLADRALHAAACRQLALPLPGPLSAPTTGRVNSMSPQTAAAGLSLAAADFAQAQEGFQPAAAWGVGQLQVCKQ